MKTLIQGIIYIVFSFWLLLVVLVFHSLGWTGGYIALGASLIFLLIGTERLAAWSVREPQ